MGSWLKKILHDGLRRGRCLIPVQMTGLSRWVAAVIRGQTELPLNQNTAGTVMWLTGKIGLSKNTHYALSHLKVVGKVDQSDSSDLSPDSFELDSEY